MSGYNVRQDFGGRAVDIMSHLHDRPRYESMIVSMRIAVHRDRRDEMRRPIDLRLVHSPRTITGHGAGIAG